MSERKSELERVVTFDLEARAEGSETIPVVISSDAVVMVEDGPEILVHTREAIDLRRAPLPIIATHGRGQVNVGRIDNIRIEGGRMRGDARFGERDEAAGYKKDVLSGVISSVSVGYARMHAKVRSDGVLVTDRWMPSHAAMVAEPADINAGFFRSAGEPAVDFVIEQEPEAVVTAAVRDAVITPAGIPAEPKERAMSEVVTAPAGAPSAENSSIQMGVDLAAVERLRIKELQLLGKSHELPSETVARWIDDGITSQQAAPEVLKHIRDAAAKNVRNVPTNLGMSQDEVKRYSITRAIKACVEKSWAAVAPYEADVSRAVAARIGRSNTGEHTFFVPLDVQWAAAERQMQQQMQRDLIVGTNTIGGYLVGTNTMSFIEMLRNRSVVMRLGATTMPGLVGSVSIPKQTGAATAYWFASEAGTATESTPAFGQLALTPKTVGGYVELSRQLLLQSTPNAEGIVNSDLARVIGLAVDAAAIAGPGTAGQPTGITGATGVGTANPSTGTAVTYADMIRFQTTVAASNAMMPGFAYVTTPTVAGVYMGKPRFTNSDTPIWGGNILDGQVVGARAMTSLQVGSGTVLGGDFSQVVIGEWGVLEIEANPYAQFQSGIVGVRALYSCDVGVRYGAAFALGTGFIS
jgi:HK97 family phage major capsid protein